MGRREQGEHEARTLRLERRRSRKKGRRTGVH